MVDPITLAGLACELRGGRHRAGVACLPVQDKMDEIRLQGAKTHSSMDVGAMGLVLKLAETRRDSRG